MHPVLRLHDGYPDTSPELADEVKRLQSLLARSGFAVESDGLFGDGTEEQVRECQRAHELLDDGVVGPRTWALLEGEPPPDPLAVAFPTTFAPDAPGLSAELAEAAQYRAQAVDAVSRYGLPLCVVAGVASRESGWGLMLKPKGPGGTGDFAGRAPRPWRSGALPPDGGGFGRGLLQIDYDSHEFARSGRWRDPAANLLYGAGVLEQNRAYLERHTALTGNELLCAALAAYNCGAGNVLRALQANHDVDFYTSGRDYGRDALNRAGWFLLKGWA